VSAGWVALAAMLAAVFFLAHLLRAEEDAVVSGPLLGAGDTDRRPDRAFSAAVVATARTSDAGPGVGRVARGGMGVLVEILGPDQAVLKVVEISEPVWVGSSEHCRIRLDGDGVEPLHARLTPLRGGAVRVDGFAASSGVYVEDQPISMHPVAVPGEVIGLASSSLRVGSAWGEQQ
jgi:hypothetical protein